MRTEVITAVAHALRWRTIDNLGFNMRDYMRMTSAEIPDWTGNNNSVCADIAGWTCALFTRQGVQRLRPLGRPHLKLFCDGEDLMAYVESAFAISEQKSLDLVSPGHDIADDRVRNKALSALHIDHAADVLMHLAKTGDVVWDTHQHTPVTHIDLSEVERHVMAHSHAEIFPDDPRPTPGTHADHLWKTRNWLRLYGGSARPTKLGDMFKDTL